MPITRSLLGAFLNLFRRERLEQELRDEIQFHLESRTATLVDSGLSPEAACRQARLEFGSSDAYKDECREAYGVRWLDALQADLRYAWRTLRRTPMLALSAIITIALGVGANALVFSVMHALLLRPLPIKEPRRVVFVQNETSGYVSHSFPVYRDLRDRNVTFDGLVGYRIAMMGVEVAGQPLHVWGYLATANYFDVLGVRAAAGRLFDSSAEGPPGSTPYVVLSYDLWRRRFTADPAVIGTTIRINRSPYRILGVAPDGFQGTEIFYRPELWVPMAMQAEIEVGNPWLENRFTANTWIAGRLKPGVSVSAATNNLNAILADIGNAYPKEGSRRVRLTRPGLVGDSIRGPARSFAAGVLVLAIIVLLTACANIAGVLAARGADRGRELAIRVSIGANRGRIMRQLLTEHLLLAVGGGAVGLGLAWMGAEALSAWQLPLPLRVQFDIRLDAPVILFGTAVTMFAGLLVGVAPARQAARTDPALAFKTADGSRIGSRWLPMRELLIMVQIAFGVVLVAACFLSIRGLSAALNVPIGFEPHDLTMVQFDLGLARYGPSDGEAFRQRMLDAIRQLPGVQRAAYASSLPLSVDQSTTVALPEIAPDVRPEHAARAVFYSASPEYLSTVGTRLIRGRDITSRDTSATPLVALVNEAFARALWPGRDPVGQRFRRGAFGPLITVIGVVEDGKYRSLAEEPTPAMIQPMLQAYNPTTVLLVRAARPSQPLVDEVRRTITRLDPGLPLFGLTSARETLGFVLFPMRAAAMALGAFGLLAALIVNPELHKELGAIRSSPHVRFAAAIVAISCRTTAGSADARAPSISSAKTAEMLLDANE